MSSQHTIEHYADTLDPRIWKISGVVFLGPFITALDSTIVNLSLDNIGRDLGSPITTIQWVISGYLLSLALVLPLSGWLVDRIGAKRVYLYSFTIVTLTSFLCGEARSAGWLIFFRVLQGFSGGLLAPMHQMMIARLAGRHATRVMGITAVPVMLGPILGPVVAGAILQYASWPWIFFVNIPVGLIATYLAWRILPEDGHELNPRHFDLLGFVLLSPALVMLLHGLEAAGSGQTLGPFGRFEILGGFVLLAAFIWHGLRRGREALIDLRLFAGRTFSAAVSTQFLQNGISFGGQLLLPLYLLLVANRSSSEAGLLIAPLGLGMLCTFPTMGILTERFGPRVVSSCGAGLALLATLPFVLISATGPSTIVFCLALFIRGAGLGCINIPSMSAVYGAIPRAEIPMAATAVNIMQRLGGPIVTTFLAIFLHYNTAMRSLNVTDALKLTFMLLCAIHVLTLIAALRLPARVLRQARNLDDPRGGSG